MLTLRFQRQGKKKDFVFRIVAVDSKTAINSGKTKEILGWLNPKTEKFELKKDRILYWINQGAQASDSCYNFLVKAKIIEGKKRPIKITKKKVKKGQAEGSEQSPQAEEKPVEQKPEDKPAEDKPEEQVEEKAVEEKKEEKKEKAPEEK